MNSGITEDILTKSNADVVKYQSQKLGVPLHNRSLRLNSIFNNTYLAADRDHQYLQ